MTNDSWVLATETTRLAAMIAAVRDLGGRVTVAAVGPRALADAAAAAGADRVAWIEPSPGIPAEAYAAPLAHVLAASGARAVLAATTPAGRVLLGAAGATLGAPLVSGALRFAPDGATVVVERSALGGRAHETLAVEAPVAGLFGGDDGPPAAAPTAPTAPAPTPVERLDLSPAALTVERTEPAAGAGAGVTSAERVVSVGRGLKAKTDLPLVEALAAALGAEIGCSMPIADDYGWVAKDRYVGRSGQHISPRLYLAVGISGATQHMDGVRDAKTIVAINSDPEAHIFQRADYGIVGDLYDVIPALAAALGK